MKVSSFVQSFPHLSGEPFLLSCLNFLPPLDNKFNSVHPSPQMIANRRLLARLFRLERIGKSVRCCHELLMLAANLRQKELRPTWLRDHLGPPVPRSSYVWMRIAIGDLLSVGHGDQNKHADYIVPPPIQEETMQR